MPKKRLGELLVQRGVLTPQQLDRALALQREEKGLLGEVLLRMGIVRRTELGRALAEQHGVPFVGLEDERVDAQVAMLVPESFCRQHVVMPFRVDGATLQVAMVQPDDLWVTSEIELLTGYEVEPCVSGPASIVRTIEQCFDRQLMARQMIVDVRLDELKKGGGAEDAERFHLDKLGFSPEQRAVIDGFLGRPYGMILVTGPTGSGKSTSLYAMLNHLNEPETNIITLEDPVENEMYGMNQIGVNPAVGMTFATGLKYILRQDPDIVMVGEIRDGETAEIAVQAALTGHLLLSTLHTNDAAGAVIRLLELGVQPFLVASSLIGVVAQRLLRRVCPQCRQPWDPPDEVLAQFGADAEALAAADLVRGDGCDQCLGTGYRGRCAVFELLRITPSVVELIEARASTNEVKALAMREGMRTLMQSGIAEALAGRTTLDEVRERVLVWEQADEPQPVAAG